MRPPCRRGRRAVKRWRGQATLELHDSPVAELTRLAPREMLGGYYRSVGMSWDGGTRLDPA